ncbi:sarcosine oxidase subunit alpha family protein [Methylobrevis albus]|uniref:Sarcosine oxidase subunit alpha family protein n=1 Tax=Methylobrevis albus TaxID=2793297 RepID=A0A931I0Y9_9HYPH|nr:sarcosine oxidase subunit alpha family protein [Methylobrevis albus]MBH0237747.1 sarcosine oxidase subunit alpha family protein [Methylobrevis albus]
MSGYRLPRGGLVDRARSLPFSFDGNSFAGHPGDTLASALLASGARLVGRSFKYHRRRGIVALGPDEPNALVELRSGARREPNSKATTTELYAGLEAASQNRWPSLGFDVMAVNGLLSPLFVAGFYYKTFKWPSALWEKLYEPLIRRAAGLGRASGLPDPDAYETATAHCDVLVVGAGPAGLAAALAAGRSGARVILAERDPRLGGRLLAERHGIGDQDGPAHVAIVEAELAALPNVRVFRRTTVFGAYDGEVGAVERVADHLPVPPAGTPRQRLWTIVPKRMVIAAGATERPIVFPGNDLPGVMLAGAAQGYALHYGVAVGGSVAVFTACDAGWTAAADMAAAGVTVRAVIDPRAEVAPALKAALPAAERLTGEIVAVAGRGTVAGVTVRLAGGVLRSFPCDTVAVGGGWQPNMQLAGHLGDRPVYDPDLAAFVAGKVPAGMALAGAAAGAFGLGDCLSGGAAAGVAAADAAGFAATMPDLPAVAGEAPTATAAFFHVTSQVTGGKPRQKAFADLQHDVTDADVALAAREGYVSVEHLKRYTTLGMATDQGRTANLNGLAILAALTGRTIPETGIVTARPPVEPVAIGAFAGHHRGKAFRPRRLAPTQAVAEARGAAMIEVGPWWRAQYFPLPGETTWRETVDREVKAVRAGVGVTDMSTLGKIEVGGPDAARFLDRVYANDVLKLKVGRCAYGLMLREDGFAFDDGTIARLGDSRFVVTTSTAHAAAVMEHMEFCRQALWPELDVAIASVSEQWAQLAVAGPNARALVARVLEPGFDLSNAGFPFVACAETTVLGDLRARLFRLSFSGELAYEIAVPAASGARLMQELLARGADLGAVPYGTETVGVLRIEKGHPAGAEFSGQVSAHQLGLGGFAARPGDCIGRVLAARHELTDPARGRLVGLVPADGATPLRTGSHLLPVGAPAEAINDQGYVTSAAFSPTLGHPVALAYLAHGDRRRGETIRVFDPLRGGDTLATVVAPAFVDPEGTRSRG